MTPGEAKRHAAFVMALVTLQLLTLSTPSLAQSVRPLTLSEVWSIQWPGVTRITRVVPGAANGLVLESGSWIHRIDSTLTPALVGNFEVLDIAGLALTDAGLELLDRRTRRLVRIDTAGHVLDWVEIPVPESSEIVSGVRAECGWFLGLTEQTDGALDRHGLSRIGLSAAAPRWIEIPFRPEQVTATGGHIVVSEAAPPYRVGFLRCDSARWVMIDTSDAQAGLDVDVWRPLPAFFGVAAILQTWVDPRSDSRRFAVYDPDGQVRRFTDVDAPFTLVAATCSGIVIGMRTIEGVEIVGFESEPHRRPPGWGDGLWACR